MHEPCRECRDLPRDLSQQAIKLARRIQALEPGRYQLVLDKTSNEWLLSVMAGPVKIEVLR